MKHYDNQMRAAKELRKLVNASLQSGNVVNISKLKLEILENYPVSLRFITEQVRMIIESDHRIIEEDGELWLRLDSAK